MRKRMKPNAWALSLILSLSVSGQVIASGAPEKEFERASNQMAIMQKGSAQDTAVNVTGFWTFVLNHPQGLRKFDVKLVQEGDSLLIYRIGAKWDGLNPFKGRARGKTIRWEETLRGEGRSAQMVYEGTMTSDTTIMGELRGMYNTWDWKAVRKKE